MTTTSSELAVETETLLSGGAARTDDPLEEQPLDRLPEEQHP